MPKEAARRYADAKFTRMMLAKVYCVQMMGMLSYDFLFQDVDLVWFKDPLTFFHDQNHPWYNFDLYFQDDGNHAPFYAPYSANTGFYYVRNNARTKYFFNAVLMNGDLILGSHSHQIALISVLNEHTSMYGLTVKILSRDQDEFPGGYHFHNRRPFMREYLDGKQKPFIFHMSWTESKVNKKKFFEQLGLWYFDSRCSLKTLDQLGGDANGCCLSQPDVRCHFRDKPSVIPCRDYPPIDKGRASFWP
jgi:Nucleotide-diphospho-sugar transferase